MRMLKAVETICTFLRESAATYGLKIDTGESDSEYLPKPDTDIADDV